MIICRPLFPVIDFVLKVGGTVYLIQASISSYRDHQTKIQDLHSRIFNIAPHTVWELFTLGLPEQDYVKGFKSARVRYVYITNSDDHYKNRLRDGNQYVILLDKAVLQSCLGTSWDI